MSNRVLRELTDGIASIRLNSPDSLNAIDMETAHALLDAVRWVARSDARVVLMSGSGRAFCAGGDLRTLQEAATYPHGGVEALIEPMHATIEALAKIRQPVIASVHGAVAGAGMSLALAADMLIAADNAVFSLAYVKVGASPDCGASWYLPRIVGSRRAMEIALLGDSIDAAQAERLGLANRVVPAAVLEEESRRLALRLVEAAPFALRQIKELVHASMERSLSEQLLCEQRAFVDASRTPDFQLAVKAFLERRMSAGRR
jgi:2-(1,2-epoxy-1,2-dihydrophenyl)acetyl-CoA isomerase